MLTVLLLFFYILCVTFSTGFFALRLFDRLCGVHFPAPASPASGLGGPAPDEQKEDRVFSPVACLFAGLVFCTAYAQWFSLFAGVGLAAQAVLLCLCAAGLFVERHALRSYLHTWKKRLRNSGNASGGNRGSALSPRVHLAVCGVLLAVFAYGTSHGYAHYDTGLYHAQAVRFAETLGVVKGLGNLHHRLAYNSAVFPLTALFSFSFFGGQSFHVMSGFTAMLLAFLCVPLAAIFRRRSLLLSDWARLAAAYYLFGIFDEMVSPASDYFVCCAVFSIAILWTGEYRGTVLLYSSSLSDEYKRTVPLYSSLCILACTAFTLKISATPLLLLAVYPVASCLAHRGGRACRPLVVSLSAGLLVVLPFLIRNVILSGWLVYPLPGVDLFDVAWKIPQARVARDALEIRLFGRGITDYGAQAAALPWFADWFRALGKTQAAMFLADVIALPVWCVTGIRYFFRRQHPASRKAVRDSQGNDTGAFHTALPSAPVFVMMLALYAGFALWFSGSPAPRQGMAFLMLPAFLSVGALAGFVTGRGHSSADAGTNYLPGRNPADSGRVLLSAIPPLLAALLIGYKSIRLVIDEARVFQPSYLLVQEDYEVFETVPHDLGGITIHLPVHDDRTGYEAFPGAPAVPWAYPAGETLREGFLPAE